MDCALCVVGEAQTAEDRKSHLLQAVSTRVNFGDKIGILGANGAGKSTLIKLIMQELRPTLGTCYVPNGVLHGYFAQPRRRCSFLKSRC